MVADFAYYHLNNLCNLVPWAFPLNLREKPWGRGCNLCGKLNWSRRNSMQRSISWTKTTKADDKEYNNLKLVDLQL